MSLPSELEVLIQGAGGHDLKSTGVAGVFRIAEPLLPTGANRVGKRKSEILRVLGTSLPHCAICLDAHDTDLLATIGQAPSKHVEAGAIQWVFLEGSVLEKLIPMLYRGAWGLFFSRSNSLSPTGPKLLTFEEHEAQALTSRVGAVASVISWYDDVDWLVTIVDR